VSYKCFASNVLPKRSNSTLKIGGGGVKQKIHPAAIGVILALAVAVLVYFGFKTATEKPIYPGLSAPNAARGDRTVDSSQAMKTPPKNADDARKMGIPGAVPGSH